MRYSLTIMSSRLSRSAGLEHLQHAVRDDEAADYVARGRHNRNCAQNDCQLALTLARQDDRAHHRDCVQRVGQGHKGCVQQRRNTADHLKSDKCRQHENVESSQQIQFHQPPPPAGVDCSAGSEKNSLTRALTTSPSYVTSVSRMISSFRSNCSFPSLTRCCKNALTFRAYNALA